MLTVIVVLIAAETFALWNLLGPDRARHAQRLDELSGMVADWTRRGAPGLAQGYALRRQSIVRFRRALVICAAGVPILLIALVAGEYLRAISA